MTGQIQSGGTEFNSYEVKLSRGVTPLRALVLEATPHWTFLSQFYETCHTS